jgi:hypothetical protein
MKCKILLVILVIGLVGIWVSLSIAGQIGYRLSPDREFALKAPPGPPSSSVVAADALLARPLGLATTIAGAGVFLVTLPLSLSSGSTDYAAWGLVGRPGAYTFVRPLGRSDPQFEERGVFPND